MPWRDSLEKLAKDIASACAAACGPDGFTVKENGCAMYAEEDEVPLIPIGQFHEYIVKRAAKRKLFGLRWLTIRIPRTAVLFGLEEMDWSPSHTRSIWFAVRDETLVSVVRPLAVAFAERHRLRLDFSP